jgi:superfamily II DNA or RNA helicase/HKD family nuclease
MTVDFSWAEGLARDVRFGYLEGAASAPRHRNPQVVLNDGAEHSVLRTLRQELSAASSFLFSVAFVSPRAVALLKQEMVDFQGHGCIVTSNYLSFNSPAAFKELLNLRTNVGIDVRIHKSDAFHPKGYIFGDSHGITAMVGSSNFTENALARNHEWNLKVSAATESDLAAQFRRLVDDQLAESIPLTEDWIRLYEQDYTPPPTRARRKRSGSDLVPDLIPPNRMQQEALAAIAAERARGHDKAIIISSTGTGKTILSALDARAFNATRILFVVHREQILDRTILDYRRVLGGRDSDYGRVTGRVKQPDARYVFATVQTLSQGHVLDEFPPDAFDYIVMDEAHRAGAATHQRILSHFKPVFVLGMTATPERMDGFNVFDLFDYNVPFEIRLNRALEEDMLCPFHYYGIADLTFDDGTSITDESDLRFRISEDRVGHLIRSLEIYGQAGVPPRGLMFCSRKDEAYALSNMLNGRLLHGRPLRTQALTGEDSMAEREAAVARLEAGELDYLLSVDVFNEGIDIPTLNQVVMLRETQSPIVFVQQLGRGLRKSEGKDCLIVLDFIANYANNYMIPIALFGDDSLNKESLKQHLIAAEEVGVLPGLASIRFDRIAQARVLAAISTAKLDSMRNLKVAIESLRDRLGRVPKLVDFLRFQSADPLVLANSRGSYPQLVETLLKVPSQLDHDEKKMLVHLSSEVLTARRPHEITLLELLVERRTAALQEVSQTFAGPGVASDDLQVSSAIDTLTLTGYSEADVKRCGPGVAHRNAKGGLSLTDRFRDSFLNNPAFAEAVEDIVHTGLEILKRDWEGGSPFIPGKRYTRKEACRLLAWPRKWASTIYGYKVNRDTNSCAIFVTLHKSDDISASTAYEDELLDASTLLWYTRSRRTMDSDEVKAIVDQEVSLHLFAKKDDAEGPEFFYLGPAIPRNAVQTTMPNDEGEPLSVVEVRLHLDESIKPSLFDYLKPALSRD